MNKSKKFAGSVLAAAFLVTLVFYSCKKEDNQAYSTTSTPGNVPSTNQSMRLVPIESGRGCQGDPCAYSTARAMNDEMNLGYPDLDLTDAYKFRDQMLEGTESGPCYIACFYDISKEATTTGMINSSTFDQWYNLLTTGLDGANIMLYGNDNTTVVTEARYTQAKALLETFKPYNSHPAILEQLLIMDDVLEDVKGRSRTEVIAYIDTE